MNKLSPRGQRWLKGFYSFFACMWVGAAIVLSVKQFFVNLSNGGKLCGNGKRRQNLNLEGVKASTFEIPRPLVESAD